MPAKGEFVTQPELGVLGLREHRSGAATSIGRPAARGGVGGNGALRSARGGACENTKPKIGTGTNGRRSPRLGNCASSNNNRSFHSHAGAGSGVLGDITNIAAGRSSLLDKAKPIKPYTCLQPPVAAAPGPAAVERGGAAAQALVVNMPMEEQGIEVHEPEVDIQNPEEYRSDILNQLFTEERAFLPLADYMSMQTDITGKMRTILIDWLVEVHMKYRLRPETLHLTVNLIDRYLSKTPAVRKRLQLVGVVAMFIASKFEEISPPELHDWVYITDNAYTKEDILVMECTMLTTLGFHIMVPTAAHFFDILQKANDCDAVHREIAQYMMELGLLDMRMLQYTPSQTVAAALLLSNELLKRSAVWPASMVQESRHTDQALSACVDDLRQLIEADRAGAGGQLQAVHKKFSVPQRHGVATMQF